MTVGQALQQLQRSKFRSGFHLDARDRAYIAEKGLPVIRDHARDFVRTRLAPAEIPNDGKQTPMRGHPVFIAQHATATCCRGCILKWHGFEKGRALDEKEMVFIVALIMG